METPTLEFFYWTLRLVAQKAMEQSSNSILLPDRIGQLGRLAHNLWWSWHEDVREVFRQLDYSLWRSTSHNPVRMLRLIPAERLASAARDPKFLDAYDQAVAKLNRELATNETWWSQRFPGRSAGTIAYFCAEFALHQSLPIYAGGLGVLAGDLAKAASDLGVPLIGIGFMYPQGYFHQKLSALGWQEEIYENLNWDNVAVEPVLGADGNRLSVAIPLGCRNVHVVVWRIRVGRVAVYLLDTDVEDNDPMDRELSARLYGGTRETRLQQEIILGVGGVRVVRALGYDPIVWHLNEGHSAFTGFERIREIVERGGTFDAALDQVRKSSVFTTHTPVPAGHDAFPFELVEAHIEQWLNNSGDLPRNELFALGHYDAGGGAMFNMTALALRTAHAVNGVSRVNAEVIQRMWEPLLNENGENACDVKTVNNGVHISTWIAPDMAKLLARYFGKDWLENHHDIALWDKVFAIPDEELWNVREAQRRYMIRFLRERARQLWVEEGASAAQVVASGTLIDPAALTIGFARRMTAYKRPELIFRDPDRLARILNEPRCPVQIIFAGKAHPADHAGKHYLHEIYLRATDPAFGGRIAFVEDYDLHVAHFLVQGCDLWLNTPRKPMEASGTSGMKASINGGLHFSAGDGWWEEGYRGDNGWIIEGGASDEDESATDAADADALYRILEEEIVPLFYDRDGAGIPRRWLYKVKQAIRTVTPRFSACRMVKQYAEAMYARQGTDRG